MAVPIGGRAFEIIEVLGQSAGELVTKDDLMARVWPGTIVEENTLQVHISAVRKALGPDRAMLKTVSGRGYRLLGSWTIRSDRDLDSPVQSAPFTVPEQARPTNLQAETFDLIGRVVAVEHVKRLLCAYRMVTLAGSGGIGKTSLALKIARDLLSNFEDGGWIVELASLSDPTLMPSAVAGALGLSLDDEASAPDAVARAIGEKRLLLVLDNCEHLIDAAARTAETILRLCPNVTVLATSREFLQIEGECVYNVPPLEVPLLDHDDAEDVLRHSAVRLFLARTTALHSQLPPNRDELAAIVAICRHLDGIPLAIELAAARAATLGCKLVLSRLDDRFGLLTGGRRTALPRHQTLRATLDWSHELLPDPERILLRRLSVFAGGFTLEAAAAVVSDRVPAPSVLDGVANLVAKSLIAPDGFAPAGRWRLLETTRVYAMERLRDSGEVDQTLRYHAAFFRDLFSSGQDFAAPSPPITDRMRTHERDVDNVRAALDWAFSPSGDAELGIVLTAAFVPVWLRLSLVAECNAYVERAVDRLEAHSELNAALRMQLYVSFATALPFAWALAEKLAAAIGKALKIAEGLGDLEYQLLALWTLWRFHILFGDYRAARATRDRFVDLVRQSSDPFYALVGDRMSGSTMHYTGSQTLARRHLEQVLERVAVSRDWRYAIKFHYDQSMVARATLARVLLLQGFAEQARQLAERSLQDARSTGHELSICFALRTAVCPIAIMIGDVEMAERTVAQLIEFTAKHDMAFWKHRGPLLEGALLVRRGSYAAGAAKLRAALDADTAAGKIVRATEFASLLAEGLAGQGRSSEGLVVVDDAFAQLDRNGQRWCEPELHRVKGDLLVQTQGVGSTDAVECFRRSIDLGRRQGALFWELRAVLSLADLRILQNRGSEARQIVQPVYRRFTEGFQTRDLIRAREILDGEATRAA